MGHTCEPAAERVAEKLGFSCHHADPVVTFRNPFDLANGTMPVLELLVVGGAVFALVHAWRRWRRDGDPVNVSLWFAAVVYLAVIEPPLYFPGWFGLQDQVGFIFSHNVFTVQFMYDRLPLYIVAFYPAIAQLAYELVRALGVFERRGPLLGSVAVAFACQVFYEVFDQLGPQLKWWAWNPGNRMINEPALASVPMNSMLLFASVSFGAMTYLVVRLVGGRTGGAGTGGAAKGGAGKGGAGQDGAGQDGGAGRGPLAGPGVAWRTVVAGAVTPLAMIIVSAPSGAFRGDDQIGIQRAILSAELAAVWIAGLWLFADAVRAMRAGEVAAMRSPLFARTYPAVYLVVLVGLWLVALPAYFASTGGVTEQGTPVGSLWYTALCTVAAAGFVVAVLRVRASRPAAEPVRS